MSDKIVEEFAKKWDHFIESEPNQEHLKDCKINIGEEGNARRFYNCAHEFLGLPKRKSVIEKEDDGPLAFYDPTDALEQKAIFLNTDSVHENFESIKVSQIIQISGADYRVIACGAKKHPRHASALVEDRVVRDGKARYEVFHYNDHEITWIPQTAPDRERECAPPGRGGSLFLVKKVKNN